MRGRCALLLSVLAGAAAGCGGQGEYLQTGSIYAARGPACEYRVIRNRIVEPYEELGVIDIDAFSMRSMPDNEERFRKVVGPMVCGAGGDAVIPTLNMFGHWAHGTIIRFDPAECDRCEAPGCKAEGG